MNLAKELGIIGSGKGVIAELLEKKKTRSRNSNRRGSRTMRKIMRAARRSVREKAIREGLVELRVALSHQ
jgi:hypothetical protein